MFDSKNGQRNSLKDFLYYLRFSGKRGVIDFSYANETDSLHHNMTIKENLILDSIPTSLIKENEVNLSDFLKEIKNPELIAMIAKVSNMERSIASLDKRTLKLTSLVKALLAQREMVFLVDPHSDLNAEDISLLKKCLNYESLHNNRKIFIQTSDQDCWLDTANIIIGRDAKNKFSEKSNPFMVEESFAKLKLVA
ncbi:MAG: hypothetical protein CME65_14210 [Halobacteriovoraceae bacterium]|nr:hypothetical protein [Halobacteriovoraceae bacterium]